MKSFLKKPSRMNPDRVQERGRALREEVEVLERAQDAEVGEQAGPQQAEAALRVFRRRDPTGAEVVDER